MKYGGGQETFRQSHRESYGGIQKLFNYREQLPRNEPQKPYKFQYRVDDEEGNMHYHGQQKSTVGVVRGCYGYTDIKGLYRIVEYIADEGGFRAKILSNEPGIHRQNPAHVQMGVYTPLSNTGFNYAHPCVDLGKRQEPEPEMHVTPVDDVTPPPDKVEERTPSEPSPTEEDVTMEMTMDTLDDNLPTDPPTTPPGYGIYGSSGGDAAPSMIGVPDVPKKKPDDKVKKEDDEEFSETYEVPCYCAVGGPEVEDAVDRGFQLTDIIPERGISVVAIDKDQVPGRVRRRAIVLEGDCNCRFVYNENEDEERAHGVNLLSKNEKKKKKK